MKSKNSLFPLFFTIFNDSLAWGIVLIIFAPMLLDSSYPFLPAETSVQLRTILIGLVLAVFGLGQFLSAPLLGALSDHIGRKKVLLISLWGSACSCALTAMSIDLHSLFLLFLSRFLAGVASGNLPIAQASIADLSTEKTKAKNLSFVALTAGISWIIGPPIGGKLADPSLISWFSFATPLWITAAFFVINALAVHIKFKETYAKEEKGGLGFKGEIFAIRECFRLPSLRIALTVYLFYLIGWFFFLLFYPTLMVQKFGLNQSEIGNLSGYLSLWFLGGSLFVTHWLSRKVGPHHMVFYPVLTAGTFIFITLFFHKVAYYLVTLPFIAAGASIAWVGFMTLLSDLAGSKNQGKIFGVQQSLCSISLFMSPLVSGFLSAGNEMLPLMIGSFLILISAFGYYFFYLKRV